MNRIALFLVGILLGVQSFAMTVDPIDIRLNRNKPVSPAAAMPTDENGNFIPVSLAVSGLNSPDLSKDLCEQDKDFRRFMNVLPKTGCENSPDRKLVLEAWIKQLPAIAKVTCGDDESEFMGLLDMALYEYERLSESCAGRL